MEYYSNAVQYRKEGAGYMQSNSPTLCHVIHATSMRDTAQPQTYSLFSTHSSIHDQWRQWRWPDAKHMKHEHCTQGVSQVGECAHILREKNRSKEIERKAKKRKQTPCNDPWCWCRHGILRERHVDDFEFWWWASFLKRHADDFGSWIMMMMVARKHGIAIGYLGLIRFKRTKDGCRIISLNTCLWMWCKRTAKHL